MKVSPSFGCGRVRGQNQQSTPEATPQPRDRGFLPFCAADLNFNVRAVILPQKRPQPLLVLFVALMKDDDRYSWICACVVQTVSNSLATKGSTSARNTKGPNSLTRI